MCPQECGHGTLRACATLLCVQLLAGSTGTEVFANHCAGCHGTDARGSGKGPGLAANPRLVGRSAVELQALIQRGFPDSGMPSFDLPAAELDAVAAYVHELNAGVRPAAAARRQQRREKQSGGKPGPIGWPHRSETDFSASSPMMGSA